MFTETLFLCGWRLTADVLAQELIKPDGRTGFILPGAKELRAFSDLLGDTDEDTEKADEQLSAPFTLPGRLPGGVFGRACLSREIEFGRMQAERAELEIDQLCGTGSIVLGEEKLADFDGCMPIKLDLTDALRLGRRQTLNIRFDDARSAGIFGTVILRTRDDAEIGNVTLLPDEAQQTLCVTVGIHAGRSGAYALRAALDGTQEAVLTPWRESRIRFDCAGKQTTQFTLSMRMSGFKAGEPYRPPVLKMHLFFYGEERMSHGMLMDSRTIMTGYPGKMPEVFIPLMRDECVLAADELIGYAQKLHICALYAPCPVSDFIVRRAALEGIAILTASSGGASVMGPAVIPLPEAPPVKKISPAQACWQLCGMTLIPPVPDGQTTDDELLLEAAGRRMNTGTPNNALRIAKLRALRIRLCAEASRQGHYTGALCMPGEWKEPDIAKALREALSPLHLSVLPARGAWWTQMMFSASIRAFIPEDMKTGMYAAQVQLLDENEGEIASLYRDVSVQSDALGVLEGRLPDHACVLTLRARLLRSGAVVETQEIPVYVGERGPLEAAFE